MNPSQGEPSRVRRAAALLRDAERPIRILSTISWPLEVRERFFEQGAEHLPEPTYNRPDTTPVFAALSEARRHFDEAGRSPVDLWLEHQARAIETAARMLDTVGTPEFLNHSRRLYGAPHDPLPDGISTSHQLAQLLDEKLEVASHVDLGAPEPACHLAHSVAEKMREAVTEKFGDQAPEVVVVDQLASNAIAGPRAIRLRRTACFTDRDVYQLIHHEAFIHVATSLNGRAQEDLPILGAGHAGTTRTQEGLAVFAELMSGTLDPSRMRRLADRVLAIAMAMDGADFIEIYRYFVGRDYEPEQAYEAAPDPLKDLLPIESIQRDRSVRALLAILSHRGDLLQDASSAYPDPLSLRHPFSTAD